ERRVADAGAPPVDNPGEPAVSHQEVPLEDVPVEPHGLAGPGRRCQSRLPRGDCGVDVDLPMKLRDRLPRARVPQRERTTGRRGEPTSGRVDPLQRRDERGEVVCELNRAVARWNAVEPAVDGPTPRITGRGLTDGDDLGDRDRQLRPKPRQKVPLDLDLR